MSNWNPPDSWGILERAYQNPQEAALRRHRAGVPVAGYTSNTVPWELLRAAGFFPVLLEARKTETPLADRYLEPVFTQRIRGVFDDLAGGAWSFLKVLVVPRTSEQEHKLFLYLSELRRQGEGGGIPQMELYNLLHTRSHRSRAYGLGETERLWERLKEISGQRVGAAELRCAIEESNAARAAIRRLLRLRRGKAPRLSGAEALVAIGAWYFMDRTEYAQAAGDAAAAFAKRPPLAGPRVMIKGSPLDHPALHQALESRGAVVTAEDDWWGSRSAGRDIRPGPDPVAAIFRKYYLDAPSPRVYPRRDADRWFQQAALRDIEGVVFYLPPEDDMLGWDYPRHRRFLEERGIASLLIQEDARDLPAATARRIDEFVARLPRPRGER